MFDGAWFRPKALRFIAILGFLLMVASCGAEQQPGTLSSEPIDSSLPELPTVFEEYPDLFDEHGCLKSEEKPPQGVQCVNSAPIESVGDESDSEAWKNLVGFQGPFFTDRPSGGGAEVLGHTVAIQAGPNFRAIGLVRNEGFQAIGGALVVATLLDAEGTELAKASAPVLVDPLRPGEPGPFAVEASVLASEVNQIVWTVSVGIPSPASREARIDVFWDVPFGNRAPTDYDDKVEQPMPYLLVGQVVNLGASGISVPRIIYAFVDSAGVLRELGASSLFLGDPNTELSELTAETDGIRAIGDFRIVVNNGDLAQEIEESKIMLMLWVVGE